MKKEIEMGQKGKWNGQSKSEFEKNYKRVEDIVNKRFKWCMGYVGDPVKVLNSKFIKI